MAVIKKGVLSKLIRRVVRAPVQLRRWAYNFDGIDDRGQLTTKAIDTTIDIDTEWQSGPTIDRSTSRTIISQTLTTTAANQEFFMFVATNGNLIVRVKGVERITSPAIVYQPNTKYRWRLQGTTVTLWVNGVPQPAMTLTRGSASEPTAVTVVGATANNFFYRGVLHSVKINGVLWPMADRAQVSQMSVPEGNTMTLHNTTSDRWEEI